MRASSRLPLAAVVVTVPLVLGVYACSSSSGVGVPYDVGSVDSGADATVTTTPTPDAAPDSAIEILDATADASADASDDAADANDDASDASDAASDADADVACTEALDAGCTDSTCKTSYGMASVPTQYCNTAATAVVEYLRNCGDYNFVQVVTNGQTTGYYYSADDGSLVAIVAGNVCATNADAGTVPVNPCGFTGSTSQLSDICLVDSGPVGSGDASH